MMRRTGVPACGPTLWQARRIPLRFVSKMSFQSASLKVTVGARFVRPAEFTRMSILPKETASFSTSSSDCRSETFNKYVTIDVRDFRSRRWPDRPVRDVSRLEPRRRRHRQTQRDSGRYREVPPMTTATLPLGSRGLNSFFTHISPVPCANNAVNRRRAIRYADPAIAQIGEVRAGPLKDVPDDFCD